MIRIDRLTFHFDETGITGGEMAYYSEPVALVRRIGRATADDPEVTMPCRPETVVTTWRSFIDVQPISTKFLPEPEGER